MEIFVEFHENIRGEDVFVIQSTSFELQQLIAPKLPKPDRPVFVVGMARSGTTTLLNLLFATGEFESSRYRDLPLPLFPAFWRKVHKGFHQGQSPIQRAHDDGILVSPDSPEALATIPRLTRDDLEPHVKVTPLVHERIGTIPVTIAPLFTSGIMYVDIGFDLRNLPADLIPYLPLFVDALTETGAGDYDAIKLSQRIGTYTGGISATSMAGTNRLSKDYYALLLIRGKATSENIGTLLDIMGDVSVAAHLDNRERILQLIKEDKASREARVLPSGHALINSCGPALAISKASTNSSVALVISNSSAS